MLRTRTRSMADAKSGSLRLRVLCCFVCNSCLLITLLFFLPSIGSPVAAQTPKPSPTPQIKPEDQEIDPEDVISVNTTEVLLPVTVRDASGRLITDLLRKDFRVFEDGQEQTLSDLSLRQVP